MKHNVRVPSNTEVEIAATLVIKVIVRSKFPIQPSYAYAKAERDNPNNVVFNYWKAIRKTKNGLCPKVNKKLLGDLRITPLFSKNGRVAGYIGKPRNG